MILAKDRKFNCIKSRDLPNAAGMGAADGLPHLHPLRFRVLVGTGTVIALGLIIHLLVRSHQSLNKCNVCPNWWDDIPSCSGSAQDQSNCHPLVPHPNNSDFEVLLCKHSCSDASLVVSRLNMAKCREMESFLVPIVKFEDAEYVRKQLGPDSFHLLLFGAQKTTIDKLEYLGDCQYKLSFKLYNGGDFWMQLYHLYDYYNGVKSIGTAWPPLINAPLLDINSSSKNLCHHCPKYYAEPHNPDVYNSLALPQLPVCGLHSPINGAWIPAHPIDEKGFWNSNYTWSPLGCTLPVKLNEESRDHWDCLKSKRNVLVIGDSQSRATYEALIKRLTWREQPDWVLLKLNKALNRTFEQTNLDWIWDPFLNERFMEGSCHDFDYYDTILFEAGQWFAASENLGGQFSNDGFEAALDVIIQRALELQACKRYDNRPLKLIWMGINAFPPNDYYQYQEYGDWRTIPRLRWWSEIAHRKIAKAGIAGMNSMKMTLPMTDTPYDLAHYVDKDAIRGLVDELIHKIDLCNVGK